MKMKILGRRTLKDIERDYKKAKVKAEIKEKARDKAVRKCNNLLKELEDYKIQNRLYHPMSDLKKYIGRQIIHIRLVERKNEGLEITDVWNHSGILYIDEDGHLSLEEDDIQGMSYDEKKCRYIDSYCGIERECDFVGYLDICFEDEEDTAKPGRSRQKGTK